MKTYISFIDSYLKVKVSYISNGPGRQQLIEKQ
jgi:adenylosuccinate synthase